MFGSEKKKALTPNKKKKEPTDKSIFEKIGVKSNPGMSDGIRKTN